MIAGLWLMAQPMEMKLVLSGLSEFHGATMAVEIRPGRAVLGGRELEVALEMDRLVIHEGSTVRSLTWQKSQAVGDQGQGVMRRTATTTEALAIGAGQVRWTAYEPGDPRGEGVLTGLTATADYGAIGRLAVGDQVYRAALVDLRLAGDFRDAGVVLCLDVNRNDRIDRRGERFPVGQPFRIDGRDFVAKIGRADGTDVRVLPSALPAVEIPPPPVFEVGRPVPAFEATDVDGAKLRFPNSEAKGLLLLQFWATWCPSCREQLPGLVEGVAGLRERGLQVWGISLERQVDPVAFRTFLREHRMSWPQVLEGGGWRTRLGDLYGIHQIPALLLVDPRTGRIVLTPRDLGGQDWREKIAAALGSGR